MSAARNTLRVSAARDTLRVSAARNPLRGSAARNPLRGTAARDPLRGRLGPQIDCLRNLSHKRSFFRVGPGGDTK